MDNFFSVSPQYPLYVRTAWEKDTQCRQSLPSLTAWGTASTLNVPAPSLLVYQVPIKKEKERHAKRVIRAVGRSVEYVTPPRLHYLRSGWASGIVQCLCLSEGFDLRSFLSTVTPYARQLHRHADPTRNLACMNYQRPLCKGVHHG